MRLLLIIVLLFFSVQNWAHILPSHPESPGFDSARDGLKRNCKIILEFSEKIPEVQIVAPTKLDQGDNEKEEMQIIVRIGQELGLNVGPQQVNIIPSDQLNVLAALGGNPAPHPSHGAELISSLNQVQGILEFVTDGCPVCRGYYSASTRKEPQRIIKMHVLGHLDVYNTSIYFKDRHSDGPLAHNHLATTLQQYYRDYDRNEVALYFQYLQSLKYLQDFNFGTYESVELLGDASQSWVKTPSVLQTLLAFQSEDIPHWKKELLKLYEKTQKMYPANFQTKILNEGWAVMQMYLIPRYSPWTESIDLIEYAQLLSETIVPSWDNPYWLGSSWFDQYRTFKERPELSGLSELEKDWKFVIWARNFYANKNDSEWARKAFDQKWIEKHRFFLYRKTLPNEINPKQPLEQQEFIALSRDWQRIQKYIRSKFIDVKTRLIPYILIKNPRLTQGRIELVQGDVNEPRPIQLISAAKTSFAISQVVHKTVFLEAWFNYSDGNKQIIQRGVLVVEPSGQVRLYPDHTNKPNEEDYAMSAQLTQQVDLYKLDLLGTYDEEFGEDQIKSWNRLALQVSDQAVQPALPVVNFVPHFGGAIREFMQAIEVRLKKSILDMLHGKNKGASISPTGVKLKVLPEIPNYTYAPGFDIVRPPAPVDNRGIIPNEDFYLDFSGTQIGVGEFLPGDKFGNLKNQNKGKGEGKEQGESDGDGDGDGDGGNGKADGRQGKGRREDGGGNESEGEGRGDGKNDGGGSSQGGTGAPTDLKIPLKMYGELIGELLNLPNLRKTSGEIEGLRRVRTGVVQRTTGNLEWNEIILSAVEKARAMRRSRNLPYGTEVPFTTLVKEAMQLLDLSDYYVSGEKQKNRPNISAVLVVNVDLTGSMMGKRIEIAKNLIYNIKALLLANYDKLIIRYVGFESRAIEMKENEVFSKFFGGGTNYNSAIELDRKILEEYPTGKFNKYVITVGDGETTPIDIQDFTGHLLELKDELQFAGFAFTNETESSFNLFKRALLKAREQWPWLGVAELKSGADMFQAIKDIFSSE